MEVIRLRPVETLLVVTDGLALAALILPLRGRLTSARWILIAVALIAAAVHALVEGPRWQMIPAYVLTGCLLLFWLLALARARPKGGQRPGHKIGRITGAGLGALGLLAAAATPAVFPVFRLPRPTGPYQLGTVTYHWTDVSRQEVFTADPHDRRELMVQVWYPAGAVASSQRAPYIEDARALAPLARLLKLPEFTFAHLKYVRTNAVPAAAPTTGAARFPVLIFSHGRGGYRQHNTWQIEELVSHGYVVAAIDHPYAAAGVAFPDGRLVELDPSLSGAAADPVERAKVDSALPYFAQDAIFTLDQLTVLNESDPAGMLTGRLDLDHVGIFGPSLGGGIAAEACRLDERFTACLIMDMHLPDDIVEAGLRQPTMWLSRDVATMQREGWAQEYIDVIESSTRAVFESLPADGYLVRVRGAYHLDFSDAGLLSPIATRLGLTGPIGGDRAREIIGAYSRAFFGQYLKNERADLLADSTTRYPEVSFESRHPST